MIRTLLLKYVSVSALAIWAASTSPTLSAPKPETITLAVPVVKPRVFILTDIANKPDDEESFVRFLLYTNEMEVEGLAATTSTWLRDKTHPERLHERIDAYGQVLGNLRIHDKNYPDARTLREAVVSGKAVYGMAGVGKGHDSMASQRLIAAVDKADDRPLWVPVWGGANVLAQALWTVQQTRSAAEVSAFVKKLRVYAISDQDDTGAWIRESFPELFYIVSLHAFGHYSTAAWTGISGDRFYNINGPDFETVSHEWLSQHIQKGPLGKLYPDWMFIMEGDTPTILYLMNNGLNVPEHPEYGSWGGRYDRLSPTRGTFSDVVDRVKGSEGQDYTSSQATIWRWREAYQNDFAARMTWTLSARYKDANHAPLVRVGGMDGTAPLQMTVTSGSIIGLNALGTTDPDGDHLTYRWWQYKEPGATQDAMIIVPDLKIALETDVKPLIIAPSVTAPTMVHLILSVTDDADIPLTRYRRVIITVTP